MSVLSWGKPEIIVKSEEDGAIYRLMATPVEGSTSLETTEGDKTEAKKEGGEIVDVRNNKSTYVLNYEIYAEKGKKKPFADQDGIITKSYSIFVVPEDENAIGIAMKKSKVVMNTSFTAADGVKYAVSHTALSNGEKDSSGEDIPQCQFGYVKVTKDAEGKITNVEIEEVEAEADVVVS